MEETPKATEERPPSPDQSYQGVGKLIAQWQRKSEEADSGKNPPSPRRGGLVGKRAALTSSAGDKSIDKGR
jgi:AP2-associated kinase